MLTQWLCVVPGAEHDGWTHFQPQPLLRLVLVATMALLAGQHTPCGQKGWLAASLQEEALENAAKNNFKRAFFLYVYSL